MKYKRIFIGILICIFVIQLIMNTVYAAQKQDNHDISRSVRNGIEGLGWRNDQQENNLGGGITDNSKDQYGNNLKQRMSSSLRGKQDTSDLVYLKIPYYGDDGQYHDNGEMVVNIKLADEVLLIFQELYSLKYPIHKMVLVDEYGADDWKSIDDNNTSAFNYRGVNGSEPSEGNLSNHAYGLCIDLNPLVNPYVTGFWTGSPDTSHDDKYMYRGLDQLDAHGWSEMDKAMRIAEDTDVYRTFTRYGWHWLISTGGGEDADLQHFEKLNPDGENEQIDWDNTDTSDSGSNKSENKLYSFIETAGEHIKDIWEKFVTAFETMHTGRNEEGVNYVIKEASPLKNVLFIGNSRTNVNNVPSLFEQLANSLDQNVVSGKVLKDAQPLSNFLDNPELFERLSSTVKEKRWNCVVLQEQTETSLNSEVVTNSTKRIIDYISKNCNPNIEPIYKAWGLYNNFDQGQYNQAIQSFETAKSQNGGKIAYIANAFLKCHERYPEINLYYDDRHATMEGSYLATCCIYGAIFDEATEGAPFISTCSEDTALKLQKIADEVMGVTGKKGSKGGSSSEVVNYATSWVGKVHYVLRKPTRACGWIYI